MVTVNLTSDDLRKARSDLWYQDAQQQIAPIKADAWAQDAHQRIADLTAPTPVAAAPTAPVEPAVSPPPLPAPVAPPAADAGVAAPQPSPAQIATVANPPPQNGDLRAYAAQAAQRAGIDPGVFTRQIQQESGFNPNASSPAGAQGIAQIVPKYHPGVDASDPYASLDYAANLMATHLRNNGGDMSKALAAYNAGQGNVDKYGSVPPFEETQRYVASILGGDAGGQTAASVAPTARTAPTGNVNQFDLGLNADDAYAFCGPAAAMAFANTYGRNPTVAEAKQLAQKYGWNNAQGMAGINSEQKLISDGLGIPTKLEQNVNWNHVASDAQNGNPVIVSTTGHYFVVGKDPTTGQSMNDQGQLFVGKSGLALKGGSEWMSPDQMQQRMGSVQGALYADNPQSPGQSIASTGQNSDQPYSPSAAMDLLGKVGAGVQDFANNGPIGGMRSALQAAGNSPVGQWWKNTPSVLDSIGTAQEVLSKYGGGIGPDGKFRPGDLSQMTPEDEHALSNAVLAVGGIVGEPGAMFDKYGVEVGFRPPASKLTNEEANAEVLSSGAAQYQRQPGNQITPVPKPTENDLMAQWQQMAAQHGLAPKPEYDQYGVETGFMPPNAKQPSLASEPTVGDQLGLGADSGTTPELPLSSPRPVGSEAQGPVGVQRGQPVLPGFPSPAKPATGLDLFRAYHGGNVISGPATMTHVIVNSFVSPAWSLVTRTGADLLGLNFDRASGRTLGAVSGLSQAGESFMTALRDFYSSPSNVANRVDNPLLSGALKAQQATGAALHSAFQSVAQNAVQRMELGAMAGEQAAKEGLHGIDFTNRIGELMNNPLPGMTAKATDVGQRAALRAPGGTLQTALQEAVSKTGFVGNTLFPVVRIAAQSIAQGMEKSPLGLIGTGIDVARKELGHSGPYATAGGYNALGGAVTPLADRLTNNIAGTALTAWLIQKAMDGSITGNGPNDPKEKAYLLSQGWQPNSVYVPGRGYVDFHVLGPLAVPLALAGNVADSVRYAQPTDDNSTRVMDIADRIGGYLSDATGLRSLGQLYEAFKTGGAPTAAGTFVGQLASGFVPESALVRGAVSSADPLVRQPQKGDIGDYLQQGLPGGTHGIGGRTDLPPKLDQMGKTIPNPQAGLGVFSPRTGAGAPDPIMKLLGDARLSPPATPKTLTIAPGLDVPITPEQQQMFAQVRGQLLTQTLQPLLGDPRFATAPIDIRQQVLNRVMQNVDEAARRQVLSTMGMATIAAQMQANPLSAPQAFASPTPVNNQYVDENAGLGQMAQQPTVAQLKRQALVRQAGQQAQLQTVGGVGQPTPALLAAYQ